MITIFGKTNKFCNLNRRSFLKIGGFSMSAFGGMNVFSNEFKPKSKKSIIHIFLAGGPSHLDTWDIKKDAPREIRGEFSPIQTSISGIEICECFPKLALLMDKISIIRSITGSLDAHDSHQCLTGYDRKNMESIGGRPSIGSVLSKIYGQKDLSVPSSVILNERTQHLPWSYGGTGGFLGNAYNSFNPNGNGMDDLVLNGISLDRLNDRKALLSSLDKVNSDLEKYQSVSSFRDAAFGVLTSSKLADALNLDSESEELKVRYGTGRPFNFQYDGATTDNSKLLIARRLVEIGVQSVTLSYGRWDSHGNNFDLIRDHGSKLDNCLSALIEDLNSKSMLDDTLVLVWGEFGRTPRINKDGGRDHWPLVNSCLMIGGGLKTGQIIGSTNRLGESVASRPVHVQEVLSTVYHTLGIDVMNSTINDPTGRPQFLLDNRNIIPELV
jgi:hypothetical protein